MAVLIPALSQCLPKMESGEKRFARTVEAALEDDYTAWYDVPVGPRALHPDFILLNPRRGLLVIEVKDWRLETLDTINKVTATLKTSTGLKDVKNPLEQAREYAEEIADVLQRDPSLVHADGPMRGKLRVPWGYGVVLANITRRQFDESGLGEALPPSWVICKDELGESADPEAFQERLWAMHRGRLPQPLSAPQLDRIRWHIFHEVRIGDRQLGLFEEDASQIPDVIRIMDLQQEQLARSLGAGHRVIHGVAGSGKTMILGYRCVYLAKFELQKPVLVLCFNRALASWLEQLISSGELAHRVSVRTFHAWCREQLVLYGVGLPPEELRTESADAYFEQLVQRVIKGADRGLIPRAQYGAVLIDEGHDFQPEWFKLIVQMIDPATNSLLVLYDDAQSIYRRAPFTFKSVGIQAQGRTTILRLNYRNTAEILTFAYELARDQLQPQDADEDGVPLLAPETAGRHGPPPELVQLPSLSEELDYIAGRLRKFREEGTSWAEMAVLHRTRWVGESVAAALARHRIPVQQVRSGAVDGRMDRSEDSVKIVTFHSSKGLEFPVVAIPGFGSAPRAGADAKEEARLMYVAMTRAMDRLVVTGPGGPRPVTQ